PESEYLSFLAASPVYRLYGLNVPDTDRPMPGREFDAPFCGGRAMASGIPDAIASPVPKAVHRIRGGVRRIRSKEGNGSCQTGKFVNSILPTAAQQAVPASSHCIRMMNC